MPDSQQKSNVTPLFDGNTGQPIQDTQLHHKQGVMPIVSTTPSMISIPPQIAMTLLWIGIGFGIGVWMCNRKKA